MTTTNPPHQGRKRDVNNTRTLKQHDQIPRKPPSSADLDKSVEDIVYVMLQCSSYFVWWVHIKPQLGHLPHESKYLRIIQNSVIESTLLSVRKLNEFFKKRPKKDEREDDLRAYDFTGFKATGSFLPAEQLHKRIAHMTLEQARNGKVSWEIHEIVNLALNRSGAFLDFLCGEFYAGNLEMRDYALTTKSAIVRLTEMMEKAKEVDHLNQQH